jgi:glycosyltransferase involved in cell wall biosynthesis
MNLVSNRDKLEAHQGIEIVCPQHALPVMLALLRDYHIELSAQLRLTYFSKNGNKHSVTTTVELPFSQQPHAHTINKPLKFLVQWLHRNKVSIPKQLYAVIFHIYDTLDQYLHRQIYQSMAAHIDSEPEIGACFVLFRTWFGAALIRSKPYFVFIPDIVMVEFPQYFSAALTRYIIRKIHTTISHCHGVITISEHVRQAHLIPHLKIAAEKIHLLRNPPLLLSQFLPSGITKNQTHTMLLAHLRQYFQTTAFTQCYQQHPHWQNMVEALAWTNHTLLYYPTQLRPYKNIITVLQALALLKQSGHHPISLVLTADITREKSLMSCIAQEDLWQHAVLLPRLDQTTHALMYKKARLTVAASLFEGSFPFPFSESLSVGTPVIMSRIAVVTDELPEHLQSIMLFDALDPNDLKAKILAALVSPEPLYAQQMPYFEERKKRTWNDVVGELFALCLP